jgi:hypothetical protein
MLGAGRSQLAVAVQAAGWAAMSASASRIRFGRAWTPCAIQRRARVAIGQDRQIVDEVPDGIGRAVVGGAVGGLSGSACPNDGVRHWETSKVE